jgi:excisionase family DNA binding protein
MKEYLNFKEAALFLCVSESKLYKMTHLREVQYYKIGRLNVFKRTDLQDLLSERKVMTVDTLKSNALKRLVTCNN